jgi:PST family polysaccharide transporter
LSSNKVLKNFSYLGIVQLLNYALPLITIPIVSRALGVDKIGLVNYIMSYTMYFTLLVAYSFSWTAIRKLAVINDLNYTFSLVFKSQLLLFTGSTIIYFCCLYSIPDLVANKTLALFAYLSVVAVIFEKTWVYQYKQELSMVAVVTVIFKLLSVLVIFLWVKQKHDYLFYALILNGVQILTNITLFIVALVKYKIKLIQTSLADIWNFLKEGKTLFYSSVVINLYTATSVLLLGVYCTPRDVGLFTSATKVVDIAKNFVCMPLTQIIYPIVAQKIAENREQGVLYVKQLMPIFNVLAAIIFLGMIVFGPFAIRILFGQEFLQAIPMLWILSITLVLILYSTVFGVLLMVNLGLDHLFFKNQLFVAILSVLLTVAILPYGSGMTSAIILVVSECLITGYQYYCLKAQGYTLLTKEMLTKASLVNALKILRSH